MGEGLRKTGHHHLRNFRQHFVGQAGSAILFVYQERDAGDARGNTARSCGIAAKTHHRRRPPVAQHACGIAHCTQYAQWRGEQGGHAFAAQTFDRNGVDDDVV